MSVKIKPITDYESYEVNDHIIYKDTNGNWRCKYGLSHKEFQAFNQYESTVIKNPRFKKHIKATYKD